MLENPKRLEYLQQNSLYTNEKDKKFSKMFLDNSGYTMWAVVRYLKIQVMNYPNFLRIITHK